MLHRQRKLVSGSSDLSARHGVMRWPDGREYFGGWANGQRHGQGTLLYADGSMYSGEWRNGEKWSGMQYGASNKVVSTFANGIETPR